uniref:Tetraspanin-3-like n=1 Tax=Catharus ustulatus TaxID=91951 RepID=A0A8C3U6D4_CATUS
MLKNYSYLFQEYYVSLPGWLALATALILLPTGLLAVSISVKCSRNQQGTFMYLLVLLLCLEMSSAVLAYSYSVKTASQLESAMGYLVHQHNWTCSQDPGNSPVDVIQRKLQCCGVHSYTDWLKASSSLYHPACVPESCCKEKHSHCTGDLAHVDHHSVNSVFWTHKPSDRAIGASCFAGPDASFDYFIIVLEHNLIKFACKSN